MVTGWDKRSIETLLDIHGDMLFIRKVNGGEQLPGGIAQFTSTSKFDKDFFAFREHISRNGSVAGPLPGVFLMECMAQTAAFGLTVLFPKCSFLVSQFNVLLTKAVAPGTIISACKVPIAWSDSEKKIKVSVTSWQNGEIVGRGDLSYSRTSSPILEKQ
jgi:hypothetical protein